MKKFLGAKTRRMIWALAIALAIIAPLTIFLPALRVDGLGVYSGLQTTFGLGTDETLSIGFSYYAFILYALLIVALFAVMYSYETMSNWIVSLVLLLFGAFMMFFMKLGLSLTVGCDLWASDAHQSVGPWLGGTVLALSFILQLIRGINDFPLKKKKAGPER